MHPPNKPFCAKMAEPEMETNENFPAIDKQDDNEEEESRENADRISSDNTLFLRQLNLIMILSFLSLSHEECLEFQEEEKVEIYKDHNAIKHIISNAQAKKQRVTGFRVSEGRKGKFQTKVRDCRHCRRM